LLAGELAVGNRVHALDALRRVAVCNGAYLERVHFGEIGDLIEGQSGIVDEPHGSRLRHQRCVAHGKSPLCFATPSGSQAVWSSAMTGISFYIVLLSPAAQWPVPPN